MATPFENFVNAELPKRLATNINPLAVPAGKVPVTTGIGLLVEFMDYVAGQGVDLAQVLASITQLYIVNEVPERSPVNDNIFVLDYEYAIGSLCVYHNGIRLAEGKDFINYSEYSFRLTYNDIEDDDNILVDYRRISL